MNTTIARLAVQSLVGQRRGIVLAVLPVVLVLLALAVALLTEGPAAYEVIVGALGFGLVLPLVALLVTTGVLGPEIDDGSIVYLLSKPISRLTVAASKLAVAVGVTAVLGAGSLVLAGLILDPGEAGRAAAVGVGALVSGTAYCAVFVMLSALNRHGMVSGLIYVLAFEGLLAGLLSGLRYLSVAAFGRRVAEAIDDGVDLPASDIGLPYAVLAALLVIVVGALIAGQRLRSFQLRGEE